MRWCRGWLIRAEGSEHPQGKKRGWPSFPFGVSQWVGPLQRRDGEKAAECSSPAWPEGLGRTWISDLGLRPIVPHFSPELPCSVSPRLAGELPFVAAAVGGSRSPTKPIFLGQ